MPRRALIDYGELTVVNQDGGRKTVTEDAEVTFNEGRGFAVDGTAQLPSGASVPLQEYLKTLLGNLSAACNGDTVNRALATCSIISLIGLNSCQFRSTSEVPLAPTAAGTLDVSIATGADDVQELAFGKVIQADPTLELSQVGEVVALRFTGIDVPQGAGITKAYLNLSAARTGEEAGTFAIRAEAADSSAPIPTGDGAVRGLPMGYASASWETEPWNQENGSKVWI